MTDVLDVDDGVDLALRFSWGNAYTGFGVASNFRLGSPRLSDGHVFSPVVSQSAVQTMFGDGRPSVTDDVLLIVGCALPLR